MTIQLTLPYPPSVNSAYRTFGGRVIISELGRKYRRAICDHMMVHLRPKPKILEGRLAVSVKMHAPDNRKRDVDNVLKCTLDALTHSGLWRDDSQIDRLLIERGEPSPGNGGFIVVEIDQI